MDIALVAIAVVFAIFTGVNDGGSMLAASLKTTSVRPLTAAGLLVVAVVVAPAIFGTQVATTLANRLVTFPAEDHQHALMLAVAGAIAVVLVLARSGRPTSLTLALLGGILGVGVGGGLPVSVDWVVVVLALAAAAPLVGMMAAFGLAKVWSLLPLRASVGGQVRQAQRIGLVLQSLAYGANDNQKMLAVFVLATSGAQEGAIPAAPLSLLAIGGLFALGMFVGARRYGLGLITTVRSVTPIHAVEAQMSAATVVVGSAAVGAPVSMTQSLTGALIGSALTEGVARVRWHHAAGIAVAWGTTVPIAAVVAAVPALVLVRGT